MGESDSYAGDSVRGGSGTRRSKGIRASGRAVHALRLTLEACLENWPAGFGEEGR